MSSNSESTFPMEPRNNNNNNNNNNNKSSKETKLNLLNLVYIQSKKVVTVNFGDSHISLWTSSKVFSFFKEFCSKLGKRVGDATIEAWIEYIQNHAHELPTPTMVNIFHPGSKQVNIDLSRRLELKLVKTDLSLLIQTLEAKKGDQNFFMGKLKELLPKALRIYKKTSDPEIEDLLKRTEKWM